MRQKLFSLEELKHELEPNDFADNNPLQISDEVITAFIKHNEGINTNIISEDGYSIENDLLEKIKIQWQKYKSTLGRLPKKLYSLEELKTELEPNPFADINSEQIPDDIFKTFIKDNEEIKTISSEGHTTKESYSIENDVLENVKTQWQKYKSTRGRVQKKLYSLEELKTELEPNNFADVSSEQIPDDIFTTFIKDNKKIKVISNEASNMKEIYSIENDVLENVKTQWQKYKLMRGLVPKYVSIEELRKELEPNFFADDSPWRIPDDILIAFIRDNKEIKTISKGHYDIGNNVKEKVKTQWKEYKLERGLEPKSVSIDYMLDMLEPNISTHTDNLKDALFSFISSRKNIWTTLESNSSHQQFANIVIKDRDIPSIQKEWGLYKQQKAIQLPTNDCHYSLEQIVNLLEPENSQIHRTTHSIEEAIESFLINLDFGEKKITFDRTGNKYVLPDTNRLKSIWDDYKKERWAQNQYSFNEIVNFLEPFGLDPRLPEKFILESVEKFIYLKSKEKSNSDVAGITKKINPINTTYFSITSIDLSHVYEEWQSYKKETIRDYEKQTCSIEELVNLLNPSKASKQHAIIFTYNFLSNYEEQKKVAQHNNKYVMANRDQTISDLIGSWKDHEQRQGLEPVLETSKSYNKSPFIMDFHRRSRLDLIKMLESNPEDVRSRRHAMKIVDKFLSTTPLVRYDSGNEEIMISDDAILELRNEWKHAKNGKSRSDEDVKLDKLYTYKRVDTPYKCRLFRIRQTVKIEETEHDAEKKFLSAVANGYKIKGDYLPSLDVLFKAKKIIDSIKLDRGETETIHLPRRPFFGKDKFLETRFQAYSLGIINPFENFKINRGQMPEYTEAFKEYTDIVTKKYGQDPKIKANGLDQYSKGRQSIEYGLDNDMLPSDTFIYHVNPITKTAYTLSPPELGVRKVKAEVKKYTFIQQMKNKIELKLSQWLEKPIQLIRKAQRQDQLRSAKHSHGR